MSKRKGGNKYFWKNKKRKFVQNVAENLNSNFAKKRKGFRGPKKHAFKKKFIKKKLKIKKNQDQKKVNPVKIKCRGLFVKSQDLLFLKRWHFRAEIFGQLYRPKRTSWAYFLQNRIARIVLNYNFNYVVRHEPINNTFSSRALYEGAAKINQKLLFENSNFSVMGRYVSFYYPELVSLSIQIWLRDAALLPIVSLIGNKTQNLQNRTRFIKTRYRTPFKRLKSVIIINFSHYIFRFLSKQCGFYFKKNELVPGEKLFFNKFNFFFFKGHTNAGIYFPLPYLLERIRLIKKFLKRMALYTLRFYFRSYFLEKNFKFSNCANEAPKRVFYKKANLRARLMLLATIKLSTQLKQNIISLFSNFNVCLEQLRTSKLWVENYAQESFFWSFDARDLFNQYIEYYSRPLTYNELLSLYNYETSSTLGLSFLARVNHLLTKRGGALTAFRHLRQLRSLMRVSMNDKLLSEDNTTGTFRQDPFNTILWNLKTYFYQRKFTKGRKTIFIPGMLKPGKKIRIAARWFTVVTRKKKMGRRLLDILLENTREIYHNQGPSKNLQLIFNKSISENKINIIPKRGARRFRLNLGPVVKKAPEKKKKWWKLRRPKKLYAAKISNKLIIEGSYR